MDTIPLSAIWIGIAGFVGLALIFAAAFYVLLGRAR